VQMPSAKTLRIREYFGSIPLGATRIELLEKGEIEERVILLEDLKRAGRIWVINSVRKWRLASL
jgi:branched-subunit amino acid aminotransferase/4-amino-4-deoxychorismate lyase